MAKKSIREAEKNLAALKKTTDNKIWQYIILKEFLNLFAENNQVINFVATNCGALFYGFIDDGAQISEEELALYERNQEITLEEKLQKLLEIL